MGGPRGGSDQRPLGAVSFQMVKPHEITIRSDIGLVGMQRDLAPAAVNLPGDGLVTQAVGGVFGD